MNRGHLVWTEEKREEVYQCRVFSVRDTLSRSPEGRLSTFTVIDAPHWAIVIPVLEENGIKYFVMVRQWRHGANELSLEFPGGVVEYGEDIANGAKRELCEETGYAPRTFENLGTFNPNPAIMSNAVHIYLATGLEKRAAQALDDDEFLDVEKIPVEEVISGMGKPPFIHALMASALSLYLATQASVK